MLILRSTPSPAVNDGILQKKEFPFLKNWKSAAAEAPDGSLNRFTAILPVGSLVSKLKANFEKISTSFPDNESRETSMLLSTPSATSLSWEAASRYEGKESGGMAKLKSVSHRICCFESINWKLPDIVNEVNCAMLFGASYSVTDCSGAKFSQLNLPFISFVTIFQLAVTSMGWKSCMVLNVKILSR